MKNVSWLVAAIVGIVLLLVLVGGGMMLSGSGFRGYGMTGPGGMMGNWGSSPSGWMPMLFAWLVPVGFIALVVLGVLWLVGRASGSKPPSS